MNKLYQCRLELQSMRFSDIYDETAVNTKIDEMSKIQAQLQKKTLANREKIKNVLTKEQKALLGNNTGLSFGLMPYGGGIGCLGLGPSAGRGFGAGMGLNNILKCATKMDLRSAVGKGTQLHIRVDTKDGALSETN